MYYIRSAGQEIYSISASAEAFFAATSFNNACFLSRPRALLRRLPCVLFGRSFGLYFPPCLWLTCLFDIVLRNLPNKIKREADICQPLITPSGLSFTTIFPIPAASEILAISSMFLYAPGASSEMPLRDAERM